jgi:hypothetical protein
MFKTVARAMAGLSLFVGASSLSAADPGDYPAQTRWILSLDLQAAQESPLVAFLTEKIDAGKRKDAEAKLAAFNAMFGVNLLKDIDRITVAGNGDAEKGGVAYVYGRLEEQRFTPILAMAKQYASADRDGVAVQSWFDESDKKKKFIAFARPGLVLFSNAEQPLTDALDVLAKRQAGLSPDSPLGGAFKADDAGLLTLHAHGIAAIVGSQPKAESLKQAEALSLRVTTPDAETLNASLSVTAVSDETARQIQQALVGVQAIARLRAADDPRSAALASQASITGSGRTVEVALTLNADQLAALLRPHPQPETAAPAANPLAGPAN